MSDLVVTGGTPAYTAVDGFTAQVAQGQVARLWGYYRDANGAAVDPTSPLVDVVNPNGVEVVANAVPTRLGQGVCYYDFAIANDAAPGLWLVHWSGTIAGALDDDWTAFQVVAGGASVGAVGAGTSPLTLTTIGPFSFNTLLPDADGVTWFLPDLAGWDSPDVNGAFFERPGQSGLYVGESTFGGRPMVAAGVVVATTLAALGRAREAFIAAMDIDQPIRVQRNGPGNDATTATYADAYRADKLRIRQGGPLHFAFEAPLTAPDHRRHGATAKRSEFAFPGVRAVSSGASGAVGDLAAVLSVPAGTVAGDTLVAVVVTASAATVTTPAGWTLLRNNTTGDVRQAVYYRVATSAEPASYSFAFDLVRNWAGGMVAMQNVSGAPVANAGQANASSTTATAPGLTTERGIALRIIAAVGAVSATHSAGSEYWDRSSGAASLNVSSSIADTFDADGVYPSYVATLSAAAVSYGVTVAFAAAPRYIRNAGSTSSSPVLHVRGFTFNPLLVTKGTKTLRLNVALIDSDLLVIDFARRLVTLNGVLRSDLVDPTSQWFELDGDPYNLLTAAQADMEEASGWFAYSNAAVEWWKGVAKRGRQALAIRSTASGLSGVQTGRVLPSTSSPPVTPGTTVTGGFEVQAAGAYARQVRAQLFWIDVAGAHVATATGSSAPADIATWGQRSVTGVVPAGAAYVDLVADVTNAVSGDVHLVDEAFVRSGTSTLWTPGGGNLVTIHNLGRAWFSWREAWA